jgi:isoquinoline 1-oxidoreductase
MRLTLNGQPTNLEPQPERSLLTFLRDERAFTAAKPGCGEGACGACTVLVDGKPVRSCVTPLPKVEARSVQTLEGLLDRPVWRAVTDAFTQIRAFQCGFCTPGMVVAAGALLRDNPAPSRDEIVAALDGNICRCGTYPRIVRAVVRAARSLAKEPVGPADWAANPTATVLPLTTDDPRFQVAPEIPWDIDEPESRDWFERLGDGLVVVLTGEEVEQLETATGGAWSTGGGGWLHVSPDRRVTAFIGKVDVGQDNTTALTAIVADALQIRAANVELVMGDTDFCPWDIGTFGSRSTEDAGAVLGAISARARRWLARHPDLDGQRRVVFARAGDLAKRPRGGAKGRARHDRRRARAIATGTLRYTTDLSLPGMTTAPAAPPALHSVRGLSEQKLGAYLRTHQVEESGWEGGYDDERGDVDAAMESAALTYSASFETPYLAHTPLETHCAIAAWTGDRVTIWTGSQRPFGVREEVAEELGIPQEQVRVIIPPTGAGFGGKHAGNVAVQAARQSRAAGHPVKVRWTRAQEFEWAYYRPAAQIDIRAALNRRKRLSAWEHLNFNSGQFGIETPYRVANFHLKFQPSDSPFRQGSYRALSATANTFARESAMDELAHLANADPLQFRLDHLTDERDIAVLEAVADKGHYGRATRSGRATGIACGLEKGGRIATLVEVGRSRKGVITLTQIVAAYDCGAVIDRDNLINQIEGALVMGIGGALFEQVHFANGRITNGTMSDYRVPRFSDIPPISVILVDRPTEPSAGAGETPIIALAPAIANAIYALTGERRRALPLNVPPRD